MSIKGIIFDLDGVICSTDDYHYEAWKTLADKLNIEFSKERNNLLRGVSRMESLDLMLNEKVNDYSDEEKLNMAEEKNNLYKKLLENMSPKDLSDEVKNTLNYLKEKGLLLAIGSSSKNARFILDRLGLGDFFDAIVDGTDISNSKPDPEVFLKAADKIGLAPSDCLVIEDAVAGVIAGKNGEFKVIAMGDGRKSDLPDYKIDSFEEIIKYI